MKYPVQPFVNMPFLALLVSSYFCSRRVFILSEFCFYVKPKNYNHDQINLSNFLPKTFSLVYRVKKPCMILVVLMLDKTSKFREFMSPAKIFLRNTKSSENVKFIGGFIHTRYILSTYVDSINA